MGVYGLLTQKRNQQGLKWSNRYYVFAPDHDTALDWGVELVAAEKLIHSSYVTFTNIHVWLPNVTPNQKWNRPQTGNGNLVVTSPIKAEIVSRFYFTVQGSQNPHFKDYRFQGESGMLLGYGFNSGYNSDLSDFQVAMGSGDVQFCTRQGNPITAGVVSREYHFRQLSKAWYNRTPQN